MWPWEVNEAQETHSVRMEANGHYEDAMQLTIAGIQDFDQSLSLADAFILHALGVEVALYHQLVTP